MIYLFISCIGKDLQLSPNNFTHHWKQPCCAAEIEGPARHHETWPQSSPVSSKTPGIISFMQPQHISGRSAT